jgi:hypothetical protein
MPPIWRRLEILDLSLANFHDVIQTAMGWTDSHLHAFEIDGEQYTAPSQLEDGFSD